MQLVSVPDCSFCVVQVRKVLKAYAPLLTDELELIDQDFVFMDPEEVSRSKDGWFKGTSWLTGNTGMFPGVFTTRTAETWTWTLHRLDIYISPVWYTG